MPQVPLNLASAMLLPRRFSCSHLVGKPLCSDWLVLRLTQNEPESTPQSGRFMAMAGTQRRTKSRLWTAIQLLLASAIPLTAAAAATPNTVEIGELGSQASVSLAVGDVLRVVLKGNPSTGYGWQVSSNNGAVLQVNGTKNSAPSSGKVGASATQTLTFTAKAAGSDPLILAYQRPWEKTTPPARSYTLNVTVAEQGSPSVVPKGSLLGTYAGKLPCADCSGILTTISFYALGPNQYIDTYYVSTSKYLDAPGGNVINIEAGEWTLNRGSAADPNATVYCMYSSDAESRTNYQLRGNTLIALDSASKVIRSPFNLSLTKMQ